MPCPYKEGSDMCWLCWNWNEYEEYCILPEEERQFQLVHREREILRIAEGVEREVRNGVARQAQSEQRKRSSALERSDGLLGGAWLCSDYEGLRHSGVRCEAHESQASHCCAATQEIQRLCVVISDKEVLMRKGGEER